MFEFDEKCCIFEMSKEICLSIDNINKILEDIQKNMKLEQQKQEH